VERIMPAPALSGIDAQRRQRQRTRFLCLKG
jgi:hypothetical protein